MCSFFTADKKHLHHILLQKVKSTRKVLLITYGMNLLLAMVALSTLCLNRAQSFSLKISALAIVAGFFIWINGKNIKSKHLG